MQPATSPRRRWISFRLRSLLSVVTLAAICCAPAAWIIVPYEREQAAIAQLKHRSVTWDSHMPHWLPKWLGAGYLQHVSRLQMESQGVQDKDMHLVARCTRIEKIYLAGNPISDEGVKHLRDLQHLRRISLWTTKVSEACLADLATCPQLEVIDLHDKPLTTKGIEHLRQLKELKWLQMKVALDEPLLKGLGTLSHPDCLQHGGQLIATGVTDETLPILLQQKFPNQVKLISARLSSDGWMQLQASPQLQALQLDDSPVPETFFPALAKQHQNPCQSLSVDARSLTLEAFLAAIEEGRVFESAQLRQHELALYFHNPDHSINGYYLYSGSISSEQVEAIFRRLQFLDLVCNHPASGPLLGTQKKLISLDLVEPDAATLQAIGELEQLESLILQNTRDVLSPADTEPLRRLVNLRELRFPHARLTGEHLGFLSDLRQLKKLALDGNQTDADVLKSIGQMAELRELYLFDTGAGTNDDTIAALANCKKLSHLYCDRTALTDEAIPILENLPNLRYFGFDKDKFSEKRMQQLLDTIHTRAKIPY